MAVKQPGGVGTTIFVYDNAHADAGGDGSYSLADIKAAMDILRPGQSDIELQGGLISGLQFSASRKKYLLNVSLGLGGDASDGTNPTTFKETNVDLDFRVGGFIYRIAAGPIETRLGTQTGVGPLGLAEPTMGGKDGVTLQLPNGETFRNDLYIFGSVLRSLGSSPVSFLSTGGSVQQVAGNLMYLGGSNNVFGDSPSIGEWYNNAVVFTSSSGSVNGMRILRGRGNKFTTVTPTKVVAGAQATARLEGINISGVPSTCYVGPTGADYSDWQVIDLVFQDDAPRFVFNADSIADNGLKQLARLDTRVGDSFGNALINIPVRVYSSVLSDDGAGGANGGLIIDAKTFGEGNLGFVHNPSGYQNGVRVRDWYRTAGITQIRDRTFTMYVNMPGSLLGNLPNLAYPTKVIRFNWPGRDIFKGAYQKDGGSFTSCIMPVMLGVAGTVPSSWEHCEVGVN